MSSPSPFKSLHTPGRPLVLYNIWDAGSAAAVAKSNPPAIATGSWAMARAQGYEDGQKMPFSSLLETVKQIMNTVKCPVTVDFEAGYSDTSEGLKNNAQALVNLSIAGVNFEDQNINGTGLHSIEVQCGKLKTLRAVGPDLFLNARCDLMFDGSDLPTQTARMPELINRAQAYAAAGADGLFVPGLIKDLIADLCRHSPLPVNVMRMDDTPIADLAEMGVARISHGPKPYMALMKLLGTQASDIT